MSDFSPRILIASVQVPFTRGGAEVLVDRLSSALKATGALVDIVQLPFTAIPKESLLKSIGYWRSLDLTSFNGLPVDLVICTKFPSYLINHPRKITWLIHQYRQIYDLYGTRFGDLSTADNDEALRQLLTKVDLTALNECQKLFTISDNVTKRLDKYCGLRAATIVPPLPLAGRYYQSNYLPYILSVGRICSIKRIDMIICAMANIDERLTLKVVGTADEAQIENYIKSEIDKHHLARRIEFLGNVSDEKLLELYAQAFITYYAPFDEDLGFVTLESLASGTPVITCSDSGGSLAFIENEVNGLITEPNDIALAAAINSLLDDKCIYENLRREAKLPITTDWQTVVNKLLC
ncbi:MAG: glycosyltransferase [Deltaproteobacteria bacterium]|nr:glycosyltransferase [Deltaproteobacteria bacterium]